MQRISPFLYSQCNGLDKTDSVLTLLDLGVVMSCRLVYEHQIFRRICWLHFRVLIHWRSRHQFPPKHWYTYQTTRRYISEYNKLSEPQIPHVMKWEKLRRDVGTITAALPFCTEQSDKIGLIFRRVLQLPLVLCSWLNKTQINANHSYALLTSPSLHWRIVVCRFISKDCTGI
jgi:hypothetical protein